MNLRGFRALDRRTVAARSAIEFRSALVADLGGLDTLSSQRLALVESATRTWLYVQHLDCWLLEQTSLVNARRKAALPILRDRMALTESLARLLTALGLERVAPREKDLAEVIREIEQAKAARASGPTKTTLAPRGEQAPAKPADPGIGAKVSTVAKRGGDARVIPAAEQAPAVVTPRSLVPDPAYPVSPAEHIATMSPEQAPAEVPEF